MKPSIRLSQRLTALDGVARFAASKRFAKARACIATTAAERLEAARLVCRQYRAEGYLKQDDDAPFYTLHHLLPETTVFTTFEEGRITGTLSVVIDSSAGLPMEDLYQDDIAGLRSRGRALCEICSLAVDPSREACSSVVVLNLFRYATAYLLHFTSVSDALITLKPSHMDFYGRRLGFAPFGALKRDARFKDAETLAMRLTRERVAELSAEAPAWRRGERPLSKIFRATDNENLESIRQALVKKGISASELRGRLVAQKDALSEAPLSFRRCLAAFVQVALGCSASFEDVLPHSAHASVESRYGHPVA